jgi:molybdopterin synthase sulfur carrier subunit
LALVFPGSASAVTVSFFATLRPIVGGRDFDVSLRAGATVRDLAEELARRWPELREHLFTDGGALSRRVAIYVDGRIVVDPDADATALSEDQRVALIPPMEGG